MTIYIWGFSSKFAVYEPAPGSPQDILDKTRLGAMAGSWIAPALVETYEIRGKPAEPGDFPGTTGFTHLFSPRALDTVGETFAQFGSLLPVHVEGQSGRWHVFCPTRVVDCLDVGASKVSRVPFRPTEIASVLAPVFRGDRVPGSGLFVVPECPSDVYVCEDIKSLVRHHRLKGLVLSENFFDKPWIS